VSTRKFAVVGEPVGQEVEDSAAATSKTSVSEMFIERTATALEELMSRRLDDVRLAVMMLDGIEIAERTHVVALGITTDGVKIPLGLWEGSTENATLVRTLLADLVDRGLDPEQAILFVIDGGKAAAFMAKQMRLTLSPEKTAITHVDDGFELLGFGIKRAPWQTKKGAPVVVVEVIAAAA